MRKEKLNLLFQDDKLIRKPPDHQRLCIKVGRGQGDRDACVRTWDLGTREEGLGDVKYRTRGRGDVKNWDAGDPG